MYLNGFKSGRTTFMRESGGRLRGDKARPRVRRLGLDRRLLHEDGPAATELRPGARFVQPDGNDPEDQTVLAVPLSSPRASPRRDHARHRVRGEAAEDLRPHRIHPRLLPGRSVVPETRGLRAGRDAGARRRRLELPRVPRPLRVLRRLRKLRRVDDRAVPFRRRRDRESASAKRRSGDSTTYRYVQENVHDFAWTADPALPDRRLHVRSRARHPGRAGPPWRPASWAGPRATSR